VSEIELLRELERWTRDALDASNVMDSCLYMATKTGEDKFRVGAHSAAARMRRAWAECQKTLAQLDEMRADSL